MRESLSEKKSSLSESLSLMCVANVKRALQIPKETYKKNLLQPHEIHIRYRVAKTHRIPYLYRSFSAKEPYI